MSNKIIIIEFGNTTPHLETALEIGKRHLERGDQVFFYFLGQSVPYKEGLRITRRRASLYFCKLPERRGAQLLRCENFKYIDNIALPRKIVTPPKFDTIKDLMSFRWRGFDAGMAAASSLISLTSDSNPDMSEHNELISKMISSYASVYSFVEQLVLDLNPDAVYTFNGRFCNNRAVLRACEHSGVQIHLHERGCNKDKFVVYDHLPHDQNKIEDSMVKAWARAQDTTTRDNIARQFFEDRRNGTPKDWHSFTSLQTKGTLPSLPHGKRICTYFSSSDDEFVAVGEIFKSKGWPDQMAAVLDLIAVFSGRQDDHLILRLHPHLLKKSRKDLDRWLALSRIQHITVIPPDSEVSSYTLLDNSSVVFSFGSTVGIEAVYWGIPSVLLGPSFYEKLNCVHSVTGKEGIISLLNEEHLTCTPSKALPYGYYSGSFGETFKFYRAQTLGSGRFLEHELLKRTIVYKIAVTLRTTIRSFARLFRPIRVGQI